MDSIAELATAELATSTEVEELSSTVDAMSAAISGLQAAAYVTMGISVIVLMLAIFLIVRKRS